MELLVPPVFLYVATFPHIFQKTQAGSHSPGSFCSPDLFSTSTTRKTLKTQENKVCVSSLIPPGDSLSGSGVFSSAAVQKVGHRCARRLTDT